MTWKTISLALILCALAVAASFSALQNGHGNLPTASLVHHSAVVDAETIAVQEASIIAAAGQSAVAYINAARGKLQVDDLPRAKRLVTQAGTILEQIRNALHVDPSIREASGVLRVPLWAQIDVLREGPAPAALRTRLQKATRHAVQGQHGKVVRNLAETGVELVYSYIDMPLDRTLERVEKARAAIENDDAPKALALLNKATDGLESETLEIGVANEGNIRAPNDA